MFPKVFCNHLKLANDHLHDGWCIVTCRQLPSKCNVCRHFTFKMKIMLRNNLLTLQIDKSIAGQIKLYEKLLIWWVFCLVCKKKSKKEWVCHIVQNKSLWPKFWHFSFIVHQGQITDSYFTSGEGYCSKAVFISW